MSPELHNQPCPPKTRTDLEWDRVLEALADRCTSSLGKRRARSLPFAVDRDEVRVALAEVREAVDFDIEGEPLPSFDLPEIDAALDRTRIGAPLSNEELRAVIACLGAARMLRRFLHSRRHRAPALDAACAIDPSLETLERDLSVAFELIDAEKAQYPIAVLCEALQVSRSGYYW